MRSSLLLILAIASTAHADDPFACVDPDVATAFLGGSVRDRGEYSTALPSGFVEISPPAGSSLIGSHATNLMTTVVYKTDADADRTLTAATNAMAKHGWVGAGRLHRGATGGFQVNRGRNSIALLCNDDIPGALSVNAYEKSGQTFIAYAQYANSESCGAGNRPVPAHEPSDMMRLIPRLDLPADAEATTTGMGGSGHEVSARVDVSGPVSRAELSDFLESQIRDQGWEFQTSWASHHSTGSVWALDSPDNGLVVGTLHLLDSGAVPVRITFSVTPTDPANGEDRGSWSSTTH